MGSPPYAQARDYLEKGVNWGIAREVDEWVEWMCQVTWEAMRAVKGLLAWVVNGATEDFRWNGAPVLLAAALIKRGFNLRTPAVYHRVSAFGAGGPDWWRNDTEMVLCVTHPGRLPWSDPTACSGPPKYKPGGMPTQRKKDGQRTSGSDYEPPERVNPGNLISGPVGRGHMGSLLSHDNEAPYPEWLVEPVVKCFCQPGGLVVDPFSGSATTGKVAVSLGRRYVGGDLRSSQVELGRRRMLEAQLPLPTMEDLV